MLDIRHGLISCDSHAQLDKDAFSQRMSVQKWGEAIPHLVDARDPAWDPLWATCQELGVPVSFHAGGASRLQFPVYPAMPAPLAAAVAAVNRPVTAIPVFANFLWSRIPSRFPRLQVVFAQSSIGWAGFQLELGQHEYERQRMHLEGYDVQPLDLFRRHCFLTTWCDRAVFAIRDFIGLGNIVWSTNFPQANSTWPRTRAQLNASLADLPAAEREQISGGNAARLYHLGTE